MIVHDWLFGQFYTNFVATISVSSSPYDISVGPLAFQHTTAEIKTAFGGPTDRRRRGVAIWLRLPTGVSA
jgi:hypothetical protein